MPVSRFKASRAIGARVLYWAPVWLPFLVTLQLATRGLAAELRDDQRLEIQESQMAERVSRLEATRQKLDNDLRKLSDPVYHERMRRSRNVAGAELLTLDRAHVGVLAPR